MAKAKQKARKSKGPNWKALTVAAAIFLGLVLLACQLEADIYFYRNARNQDPTQIKSLIIAAIDGLGSDAVQEPLSGKVYIPPARVVFPAYPQDLQNLRYTYNAAIDSIPAQLQLTTRGMVSYGKSRVLNATTFDGVFAAVPEAQGCSRGVLMQFKPVDSSDTTYDEAAKIGLADGRTAYIYTEKVASCKEQLKALLPYLLQVQSY